MSLTLWIGLAREILYKTLHGTSSSTTRGPGVYSHRQQREAQNGSVRTARSTRNFLHDLSTSGLECVYAVARPQAAIQPHQTATTKGRRAASRTARTRRNRPQQPRSIRTPPVPSPRPRTSGTALCFIHRSRTLLRRSRLLPIGRCSRMRTPWRSI